MGVGEASPHSRVTATTQGEALPPLTATSWFSKAVNLTY